MSTKEYEDFPEVEYIPKTEYRFNPLRAPLTERAKEAVTEVIGQVEDYEMLYQLRQRDRGEKLQARFEALVTALVSDLCYRYCQDAGFKVHVSLSKQNLGRRSRYVPQVMGRTLPTILAILSAPDLAMVSMEKGHHLKGKETTIWPGTRLVSLIERKGLGEWDFEERGSPELICLRDAHSKDELRPWLIIKGKFLEYEDTPDTIKFRQEMERINAHLASADITFDTSICVPAKGPVNISDRSLRRIFNNGSFTDGGRLYGGFWQERLKKDERRGILIDGEPTISLDYSQVCPRILYGMVEAVPRLADLYTVPGLERYRAGVKKVMVSLLFSENIPARKPDSSGPLLPKKMKIAEVVRLIEQAHPAIASYFGTGIGMELMFRESQILVEVLLTLIEHGVVALPIHDAVVVKASDESTARKVMQAVFRKHTGMDIIVNLE